MEPKVLLRFTINGSIDTKSPDGFVRSLSVFGTLSAFPNNNRNTNKNKEMMESLCSVREEIASLRAQKDISKAVRSNLPAAAYYKLKSGDIAYAYSAGKKNGFRVSELLTLKE